MGGGAGRGVCGVGGGGGGGGEGSDRGQSAMSSLKGWSQAARPPSVATRVTKT